MKEIKYRFWFINPQGFTQGGIYTIARINWVSKKLRLKGYLREFKFNDIKKYMEV